MGTLSCTPGIAELRTSEGSICIDSLDGRASLHSNAASPTAEVAVHAQDNLELLHIEAACPVRLGFAPALVQKAVCSTDPGSLAAALPEGVQIGERQESLAFRACQNRIGPPHEDSVDMGTNLTVEMLARPSVYISCRSKFTAFVESWIDSFARRRPQS